MPQLEDLDNPLPNQASEVYSNDGILMGTYYIQNRNTCEYKDFPEYLVNALVAREDHRFYQHCGIDSKGLARVLFKTVLLGEKTEGGGSTITQQLAKSLFPRDTAEFNSSKFHMAMSGTQIFKEEIIALYFNSVAFTNDVYGIKSASRIFFNNLPNELKIEEAALFLMK